MASEIKEKGCLCGSDLLLTNINKTMCGTVVLIYSCDNINCYTVTILKPEKKSYKHIKVQKNA